MNVLEITALKKKYENFQLDISFNIKEGEFVALIGPNGTGKSTTIGTILNMVEKDSGDIRIFEKDHIKYEAEIKEKMGIILEEQYFYRDIKINSIIKFYSKFYPKWNWEKISELREKFDLKDNKKFRELSKGMKVKLSFIIALATGASFYLFDEPTSGLDPAVRDLLLTEIQALKKDRKISFLFTSHIMADIEYFSDRVVFINKGSIIFDESMEALKNNWKKLLFKSSKNIDFSSIKESLFKIKKTDDIYNIIIKKDSVPIEEKIKLQTGEAVKSENLSLNELFIEIVNDKNKNQSKELL